MAKIVRAMRGFSANGIDAEEGDDVTGKFDGQVLNVLRMMGRVRDEDVADEEITEVTTNREVKGTKADAKAPAAPALPPLPGV
jgi:hypothetical protein